MTNQDFITDVNKKLFKCNCKKSKCLQRYCDCFANKEECGPFCNCLTCENNEDHRDEKEKRYKNLSEK